MRANSFWIGVDLDGTLAKNPTLAEYNNGITIGSVVPAMAERVHAWLAAGKNIKIFTARAGDPDEIPIIRQWLLDNGFPNISITNCKDSDMTELWDDKAITVEKNTGRILTYA